MFGSISHLISFIFLLVKKKQFFIKKKLLHFYSFKGIFMYVFAILGMKTFAGLLKYNAEDQIDLVSGYYYIFLIIFFQISVIF